MKKEGTGTGCIGTEGKTAGLNGKGENKMDWKEMEEKETEENGMEGQGRAGQGTGWNN